MSKLKTKQSDSIGYKEGYRTGLEKGWRMGIKDALKVCQSILEYNGVNMPESEFFIELQTLKEEGVITTPDGYDL